MCDPHLDRPQGAAHLAAAVPLGHLQVAPPAVQQLQPGLQVLQTPPVPGGEGAAVLTLETHTQTHTHRHTHTHTQTHRQTEKQTQWFISGVEDNAQSVMPIKHY